MPTPDIVIPYEIDDRQFIELLELYHAEWWSESRTEADVRRMQESTDIVFAVVERITGLPLTRKRCARPQVFSWEIASTANHHHAVDIQTRDGHGQRVLVPGPVEMASFRNPAHLLWFLGHLQVHLQ